MSCGRLPPNGFHGFHVADHRHMDMVLMWQTNLPHGLHVADQRNMVFMWQTHLPHGFQIDDVISLFTSLQKLLFNLFYQDRALIPEVSVAFDGVV